MGKDVVMQAVFDMGGEVFDLQRKVDRIEAENQQLRRLLVDALEEIDNKDFIIVY